MDLHIKDLNNNLILLKESETSSMNKYDVSGNFDKINLENTDI